MTQPSDDLSPVSAILAGPHWPARVRVEPRGVSRVLIEAVTIDDQARRISCLLMDRWRS